MNKTKDNRFYSQFTTQAIRHHDSSTHPYARRTRALQQEWRLFQAEVRRLPKREGYPQGPQMPQGLQGISASPAHRSSSQPLTGADGITVRHLRVHGPQ